MGSLDLILAEAGLRRQGVETREESRPTCPTHQRPLKRVKAPEGSREAWACDAEGCGEHPFTIVMLSPIGSKEAMEDASSSPAN